MVSDSGGPGSGGSSFQITNNNKQIIKELQEIKDVQKKSEEAVKAGFITAGVGAAAMILAAPFTGGLSLAIFGIASAGSLAGSSTALGFAIKQKTTEDKKNNLTEEFRTIVSSLNSELKNVQRICEKLIKELVGAEALKYIDLKYDIKMAFIYTESLRTFVSIDGVTEAAAQYEKALNEFRVLKTKLQRFKAGNTK